MTWLEILVLAIKCIVLALASTSLFAYFTLFERRLLARFQHRVGPNRAGAIPIGGGRTVLGGWLQPAADAIKLFFKEDIVPVMADKWVYIISPGFALIPALIIWVALPLGYWPDGNGGNLLQLAEIEVAVLYLLAVTGLGVYGIAIAGWASNNKYSMLGGVRASAQVISYELALSLAVLGVVMQAQTFRTDTIVAEQAIGIWNIIPQLLAFAIFMVASTAEVVRAPFDLVEAEQELVGGYNTEYGSMKFALFFMSEYVKLIAMNAIAVTLFLGGWHLPGMEALNVWAVAQFGAPIGNAVLGFVSLGAFLMKVTILSFVSVWLRATLPRVRYDQLMDLGWKVLLPLALVNVAATAVIGVLVPDNVWLSGALGFAVGVIALAVLGFRNRDRSTRSGVTLVKKQA